MDNPSTQTTNTSARPGAKPQWPLWIACIWLTIFWFCTVPVWSPDYLNNDTVDNPWRIALQEAHLQHLAFGSDIIFTYGPLGYLSTTAYLPESYSTALIFRLLVSLWAAAAVIRLAVTSTRSAPIKIVAISLLSLAPLQFFFYDPILWLVPIILVVMELVRVRDEPKFDTLLRSCGVILLAALALGKFTLFMLSMPVLFALIGTRLVHDRKRLWEPALFVASMATFWLLSGQSPASFLPFIKGALYISAAHSQGNGFSYPAADLLGACLLLTSLLVWSVFCWRASTQDQVRKWVVFMAGCGLAFVAYKSGVSRAGTATLMTASGAVMLLCLIFILPAPPSTTTRNQPARWFLPALAAICASLSATLYITLAFNPDNGWITYPWQAISHRISGCRATLINPGHHHENHMQAIKAINQALPLPEALRPYTSDIVDLDQHLLKAWSVPYRPRPTIMDYTAQVPALIEVNRAHFAGPNAPQQVFFTGNQIDRRYPLLNQSKIILELISRYRPVTNIDVYTVLHKRPEPARLTLVPLAQFPITVGQPVELPESLTRGLIWAELDYKTPLFGRAWDVLHRTPHFEIQVQVANGRTLNPRASASSMTSGFLLSPFLVSDLNHLLWLPDTRHELDPWRVRSITLNWDGAAIVGTLFEAPMTLKLYRIELDTSADNAPAVIKPDTTAPSVIRPSVIKPADTATEP